MNQRVQPVELDLDDVIDRKTRKQLMPWWVKTVGWIILVACSLFAVVTLFAAVFGTTFLTGGVEPSREMIFVLFFLVAVYSFKAFVAFSLLFEKNPAILLAKIDSYMTVVMIASNFFSMPVAGKGLVIGAGVALVFISLCTLFLVWLHRNTKAWAEASVSK